MIGPIQYNSLAEIVNNATMKAPRYVFRYISENSISAPANLDPPESLGGGGALRGWDSAPQACAVRRRLRPRLLMDFHSDADADGGYTPSCWAPVKFLGFRNYVGLSRDWSCRFLSDGIVVLSPVGRSLAGVAFDNRGSSRGLGVLEIFG